MDFSLDELIGCPAKKRKTRKRKRDSDEVEAKKTGTVVAGFALVPMESIAKEVPGLSAMEPEIGDPTKEMEAAPPA